jgi:hypothetical protein
LQAIAVIGVEWLRRIAQHDSSLPATLRNGFGRISGTVLSASWIRGARGVREIVSLLNRDVVRLKLELDLESDAHPRYRAVLQDGDYVVTLEGITPEGKREPVGRYDFRATVE